MKLRTWLSLGLLLSLGVLLMGSARVDRSGGTHGLNKTNSRGDFVKMDANRISTFIRNNGSFNRDPGTGNAGFEWPKGTGKTANYASGLWLGGIREGVVRVAVAEYAYEYDAGPIAPGVDPQDSRWRVYSIKRGDDLSNVSADVWPVADGAPVDENGKPLLIGDRTIWCVFNDNTLALHTNMNTLPLGIEVQLTAFAFNRSDALGNNIFYKWKFINKSGHQIDSAFVTVWTDIDLGDSGDDYDGCDTVRGIGYTYNFGVDGVYGAACPATGFDFLQGPLVSGAVTDTARFPDGRIFPGKKLLKMTSFLKYSNDATDLGNPNTGGEVFNYMKGYTRTGQVLPIGDAGGSKFMFSGDPNLPYNATTNLIENGTAGDRRFMMSAGPFTMAAGDTQEVVAANLIAQGTSARNSVTALQNADAAIQTAYDLNFKLAAPPDPPVVATATLPNTIVLSWGEKDSSSTAIEKTITVDRLAQAAGATDFTYNFEGYVVYQFSNASGADPKVLATYDVKVNPDDPTIPSPGIIYDDVFNAELGGLVNVPVKFGGNYGVQRSIRITKDAYTGSNLSNAKDYYYAVTSYTYNNQSVPKTLESAVNIMTVRPTGLPGSRLNAAYGDTVKGAPVSHTTGQSEALIIPVVVNPAALTGHTYRITVDTAGGAKRGWKLSDQTASRNLVTSTNLGPGQDGNEYSFPVSDGIQWTVLDKDPSPNPKAAKFTKDSANSWLFGPRWAGGPSVIDPTNSGFGVITTGEDLLNYLGHVAPVFDHKRRPAVEIRFGPGQTQKAYAMRRVGGVSTSYVIQAANPFVDVPFTVWDVTNPAAPRQLTTSWRDNDNSATFNPPTGADDGLEIVFIYNRTYNAAGHQFTYQNEGADPAAWSDAATVNVDIVYSMSFGLVAGKTPYTSDTLKVVTFKSLQANDVYTIAGPTAPTKSQAIQSADLAAIQAVPNPYFGTNAYEKNQFGRVVRFTNLPANAKIRIFTLAGELIRLYDNAVSGGGTTLDWDLTNKNDLPVASGMYIVHVQADGIGEKVLKVAVIMSEERLDNF